MVEITPLPLPVESVAADSTGALVEQELVGTEQPQSVADQTTESAPAAQEEIEEPRRRRRRSSAGDIA